MKNTHVEHASISEEARTNQRVRIVTIALTIILVVLAVVIVTDARQQQRTVNVAKKALKLAQRNGDLNKRPYWGVLKGGSSNARALSDIVGGNAVTSTTARPYIVRVLRYGDPWCTGEILSPNYVLTAAHCVFFQNRNAFSIVAGTISIGGDAATRQTRTVTEFYRHPNYQDPTLISDVALLRVNIPFSSGPSVNGIKISSSRPAVGTTLVVAGWGQTISGVSSASNVLKESTMTVRVCRADEGMEASDICLSPGTGNACHGDSGGPLVSGEGNNQELLGISSYGTAHCPPGGDFVYESSAPFINWVNGYLPVATLELLLIPGENNHADSNGTYARSGSILFNKMVYKNEAKRRVLAFNNQQWLVTGIKYLDGLLANPAWFGGFHASTNGNVAVQCAQFAAYVVTPQAIKFTLKPGASNFADCDGTYTKQNTWLNGYPIYVNAPKRRFVGYSGSNWMLTRTATQDSLVSTQAKNFGGYHSSTNGAVTLSCSTWASYTVTME